MGPTPPPPPPPSRPANGTVAAPTAASSERQEPLQHTLDLRKQNGSDTDVAVISVNLADVPGGMRDVELEVGSEGSDCLGTTVRVKAPGKAPMVLQLPFEAAPSATAAKFSKKKRELKVTIT